MLILAAGVLSMLPIVIEVRSAETSLLPLLQLRQYPRRCRLAHSSAAGLMYLSWSGQDVEQIGTKAADRDQFQISKSAYCEPTTCIPNPEADVDPS